MHPSFAVDLASLTRALGRPESDLERSFEALAESTRSAIDSFLGLRMTIMFNGYPLELVMTVKDADLTRVKSSACLLLPAISQAEPGSVLTLFASRAGAFVDFAADVDYLIGRGIEAVTLDDHLDQTGIRQSSTGLPDISAVNQAIGILVNNGHTIEDARRELAVYASEANITVPAAARLVIEAAVGGRKG